MAGVPASSRGATPVVLSTSVTLTNATIKALSAGSPPYAVIVASPGSGYAVFPIHWTVRAHVVGAYTGRDPSAVLILATGNALTQVSEQIDPTSLLDSTNDALGSGHDFEQNAEPITVFDDQPVNMILTSNAGALGGGNAANTLVVSVAYRVVAV